MMCYFLFQLSNIKIDVPKPQIIPTIKKEDLEILQSNLSKKLDKVADTANAIEKDLHILKEENKNVRDINNKSSENLEKVKLQLNSSEQLLEKYENKLAEYNNRVPEIPDNNDKEQNDWHTSYLQGRKNYLYVIKLFIKYLKIFSHSSYKLCTVLKVKQVGT